MKSKTTAGLLALFGGIFGIHRFYLRDPGGGIFYIFLFFLTSRFFPVTSILGVLEAIQIFNMSQEQFDQKYNRGIRSVSRKERRRSARRREYQPVQRRDSRSRPTKRVRVNPFKKSGIKKYKEFDLEEAIEDFNKGLEIDPDDIALHFNLACAYSLTEDKDKAFVHLDKAVRLGLTDFEKIKTHDDLAFVRIQSEFDDFEKNGFKLGPMKAKQIEQGDVKDDVLLSQLNKLAELRKKGLLSDEEFNLEKKKLLRR